MIKRTALALLLVVVGSCAEKSQPPGEVVQLQITHEIVSQMSNYVEGRLTYRFQNNSDAHAVTLNLPPVLYEHVDTGVVITRTHRGPNLLPKFLTTPATHKIAPGAAIEFTEDFAYLLPEGAASSDYEVRATFMLQERGKTRNVTYLVRPQWNRVEQ